MNVFKLVFSAGGFRSVKYGEAIVFLVDPYYDTLAWLLW